jgi:hypothetical protein
LAGRDRAEINTGQIDLNNKKMYDEQKDIDNFHSIINGWWWYNSLRKPIINGDIKAAIKRNRRRHSHTRSINPLLCNKCGFVWTPEIEVVGNIKVSILHTDFPKRGLKKQTCQFCR